MISARPRTVKGTATDRNVHAVTTVAEAGVAATATAVAAVDTVCIYTYSLWLPGGLAFTSRRVCKRVRNKKRAKTNQTILKSIHCLVSAQIVYT